jgi:trehalose 6-phosphate synthase/phosphatase
VQLVFEYFCERTPRSFVEQRGTSLVWNYKYADVEFGRIQARDLLQHLLTGPISNAPVDIVRGAKSIEVRPVGVSKGSSMERLLQVMAGAGDISDVDFVLVAGHFLARDENVFTLFEGQQPAGGVAPPEQPAERPLALLEELSDPGAIDRMPTAITPRDVGGRGARGGPSKRASENARREREGNRRGLSTQIDLPFALPPKHLYTCTVGRAIASKAK